MTLCRVCKTLFDTTQYVECVTQWWRPTRRLPSETPSEASAASAGPASGPAPLPALGPSAERVEIRATGKNLDLSPGCWVQKVLRDAPDFMLEQRGDATFFRTSDGVRETEVPSRGCHTRQNGQGQPSDYLKRSTHHFQHHFLGFEY